MSTAPINPSPESRFAPPVEVPLAMPEVGLPHALTPDLAQVIEVDFSQRNSGEEAVEAVQQQMREAIARFQLSVAFAEEADVSEENRRMEMTFADAKETESDLALEGWTPKSTYKYSSNHPYAESNPELAQAAKELYRQTAGIAHDVIQSGTKDPRLTYLSARRKQKTVITDSLGTIDDGVARWLESLPDAECLRPVAHPWKDGSTVILQEGELVAIPNTKTLNAFVGGSEIGRSVIEREEWEKRVIKDKLGNKLSSGTLRITSLGTGTGEPAIDTGIEVLAEADTETKSLVVTGFDFNPNSLRVASAIAETKSSDNVKVEFHPREANLLKKDELARAVSETDADVIEAIGFAEYVPEANPSNELEKKQRKLMERGDMLSAEDFYQTIYENMKPGTIFVTGNMRDDGQDNSMVFDGMGWEGVITRSTEDYLSILKRAGIPGDAVELYVPDSENSGGHFNLVVITKL